MGGDEPSDVARTRLGTPVDDLSGEERRVAARLREAGIDIEEVAELYHFRYDVEPAVTVLIESLTEVEDWALKATIALALRNTAAKRRSSEVMPPLLEEYSRAQHPVLRQRLAETVAYHFTDDWYREVHELAVAAPGGDEEGVLLEALGRTRSHRAEARQVFLDALDSTPADVAVAVGALRGLRRVGPDSAAAQRAHRFLEHPEAHVRKEAKRIIEAVEGPP